MSSIAAVSGLRSGGPSPKMSQRLPLEPSTMANQRNMCGPRHWIISLCKGTYMDLIYLMNIVIGCKYTVYPVCVHIAHMQYVSSMSLLRSYPGPQAFFTYFSVETFQVATMSFQSRGTRLSSIWTYSLYTIIDPMATVSGHVQQGRGLPVRGPACGP